MTDGPATPASAIGDNTLGVLKPLNRSGNVPSGGRLSTPTTAPKPPTHMAPKPTPRGAMTPRAGSATPRGGSMTPRTGSQTPRGSGSATPRGGSATPSGSASGDATPRSRAAVLSASKPKLTGGAIPDLQSSGLMFEITRLRNDLRAKARELEDSEDEVKTLRATVATKDRALAAASAQRDAFEARCLSTEENMAKAQKEVRNLEGEKLRAASEAAAAARHADKLAAQMAAMPKDLGYSDQVAALESEVRALKAEAGRLAEDNKAAAATIRAKDKELDAAAARVAEADRVLIANKELENVVLGQRKDLEDAAAERSTLLAVQRQKATEIERMAAAVAAADEREAETARALLATQTELHMSQDRAAELAREVAVLQEELARTGAVAARATRRELAGGDKDEGVVPVVMHLEEVRYLQSQIDRLKEKVKAADKAAQAAHAQKELLHKKLDALLLKDYPAAMPSPRRPGSGSPRGKAAVAPTSSKAVSAASPSRKAGLGSPGQGAGSPHEKAAVAATSSKTALATSHDREVARLDDSGHVAAFEAVSPTKSAGVCFPEQGSALDAVSPANSATSKGSPSKILTVSHP